MRRGGTALRASDEDERGTVVRGLLERQEDSVLLRRARAGDASAADLLARRHVRAIGAFVTRLLGGGDPDRVDDLVQDTFATAFGRPGP